MKLFKNRIAVIMAAVVLSACVASIILIAYGISRRQSRITIDPNAYYPVTYVVDGDTFKVDINGKEITIRVLGINTPETVDPRKPVECYGPEASKEGKELLSGRKVELKFNPNREQTDKYGRYLMYAYRDDGLFYNEYMIVNGYAREYTVGTPYSFQKQFRTDEESAKAAHLGLWGACNPTK